MKNHVLKLIIFLTLWGFIYWISKDNFGVLSFLIAYLFVYSIGKDALLLLAKEFDNNHNSLAATVMDLSEKVEHLTDENESMREEINNLKNLISDFNTQKSNDFDHFS